MAQQKMRTQRGPRPLFNETMTGKSDLMLVASFAVISVAMWWMLF